MRVRVLVSMLEHVLVPERRVGACLAYACARGVGMRMHVRVRVRMRVRVAMPVAGLRSFA